MEKEIGGYIELDSYRMPMFHAEGIKLNSGRGCLWYLLKVRNIKKIAIPRYCCDSVRDACIRVGVKFRYFEIDDNFLPKSITLEENEWLYIVNYYGQLADIQLKRVCEHYKRVIVDNAQAYFNQPMENIDTLYTCRKFFGVSDGGILYTNKVLKESIPVDESWSRMTFLMGRYERTASEFYSQYKDNNDIFKNEGIKQMSKLTTNLLHGIDYSFVEKRRKENFVFLHNKFRNINRLKLIIPNGPFAYPLLVENGAEIRNKLIKAKIYVPCLWPNVKAEVAKYSLEYNFAENILPLPIDQRYDLKDMDYLSEKVIECIGERKTVLID